MTHPAGEPDCNVLAAYLDHGREEAAGPETEEHLSGCAECRATVALYARASERARGARTAPWPSPWTWLGAAAGLLLVTLVGLRVASTTPREEAVSAPEVPAASARDIATAPPEKVPAPPAPSARGAAERPAPAVQPPAAPSIDESLLPKRSAQKRAGGKTFRLVAGEWVDTEFDPLAGLPTVSAATQSDRERLFARLPALAGYASLGDRVLVVSDGTVYRFRQAPRRALP